MFYIRENEQIILYDEDIQKLQTTIVFMPQYKDYEILETEENQVIIDFKLMTIEEVEQKQATEREIEFKSEFFEIPEIPDIFQGGWYRRCPLGYQSAVESINSLKLWYGDVSCPQGTIKVYPCPDFTKPEECTKEWLEEHIISLPAMSPEDISAFGRVFMIAWNAQEHVRDV